LKNPTSGHVEVNLLGIDIHAIHSPWGQTIAINGSRSFRHESTFATKAPAELESKTIDEIVSQRIQNHIL
jgi:hypothetical protein